MNIYRITGWGQPVGFGATGAMYAHVSAVCKKNGAQTPYFVANELVAAELGRTLRLPVPPGFIVLDASQIAYYASLDFNLTGVALPPIIPNNFAAAFPEVIGLILVFDILIANQDRHPGNISADYGNSPRFNLYDHSHALLGAGGPGTGIQMLQNFGNSIVVGPAHALIATATDEALLVSAIERVESIPEYFIASVVHEAASYGLSGDEERTLTAFLQDRKRQIRRLVGANKPSFPGVAAWRTL